MSKSKSVTINKLKLGDRVAWRVTGTVRGERIDKRFSCESDAKVFAEAQELARTAPVGRHTIDTHLSYPEIHDAERALELLDGKGSLTDAVTSFLANWVEKDKVITMKDAYAQYLEKRIIEHERKLIAKDTFKTYKSRISRLVAWTGEEALVSSLNKEKISAYLDAHFTTAKTYQNYRGVISQCIKWCVDEGYLAHDVMHGVPNYAKLVKGQRGLAETLSPQECEKLLRYVEGKDNGAFVPYLALTMFCGVRPSWWGEAGRLDFERDVNLHSGMISITPEVSKVNNQRNTPIPENALKWLLKYPCEGSPCKVKNFRKIWRKIRTDFGLKFDVLRHTAITYHLKMGNSLIETARIFGNSESILEKHYINANRTKEEAEKFFSIQPLDEGDAKLVKFA